MTRTTPLPLLLLAACSSSPPPASPEPRPPALRALDRLVAAEGDDEGEPPAQRLTHCVQAAHAEHPCAVPGDGRTFDIRLALDPRYTTKWPSWRNRLDATLACVNTIFAPTAIRWHLASVLPWPPGAQRHDLRGLLDRLRQELPPQGQELVLGVTVWDERKIYSAAGGEIGLSRGLSCVVPSWPRVENDCLIMAHELGHLVGATHVPGKRWLMGWASQPFHLPARDPIARVLARYHLHPRNRRVITMHARARFTPVGLRLPPSCAAQARALSRCWRLRR